MTKQLLLIPVRRPVCLVALWVIVCTGAAADDHMLEARSLLAPELTVAARDLILARVADAGSHLRAPGAAPEVRLVLRDESGAVLHSRTGPLHPDQPVVLRFAPEGTDAETAGGTLKTRLRPAPQRLSLEVVIAQKFLEAIDHCPMTLTLSNGTQEPAATCGGNPCCDTCGPWGSSSTQPLCRSIDWLAN